jgi:DnaJ-class molecular chaperone
MSAPGDVKRKPKKEPIKMQVSEAASILGIELPISYHKAKSAFRTLSMFTHPDRGGDPEKFIEVKKAFEFLCDSNAFSGENNSIKETVNGIPLSEFGKGYPLSVSAKTCGNCEGKGYRILKEKDWRNCPDCLGTGRLSYPCNRCNATGVYKRGDREVGKCFKCDGKGRFFPKPKRRPHVFYSWMTGNFFHEPCKKCRGSGISLEEVEKTYAIKCDDCKGIGEIEMFNPVLPRGLLRGARSK